MIVAPTEHIVTVYTDWYRVLAGKEDLAEFVRMVALSIETAMGKDAALALNAGLSASSYPAQFRVSGAFDPATLIALGERVGAYNYGARPVILGTASALAKVAPDSTLGFRLNVEGKDGAVGFIKDFYGFPMMILPQYATGDNFGLALPDDTLYIVSPAMDKLVKGVVSNTITNTNQHFDNADLTQNYTMRKDWAFEFLGAAYGATYKITG